MSGPMFNLTLVYLNDFTAEIKDIRDQVKDQVA